MCIPCAHSTGSLTRLRFGLLNVRSLVKRDMPAVVCDSIASYVRDVFVLLETWHDDFSTPALALAPPRPRGYYCVLESAKPSSASRGEGIPTTGACRILRVCRGCKSVILPGALTFEHLPVRFIGTGGKMFTLAVWCLQNRNDHKSVL